MVGSYVLMIIIHKLYKLLHSLALTATMAMIRRQHDVAQVFRSDSQLRRFILTDITPTGRVLETGSYGSVEEVSL